MKLQTFSYTNKKGWSEPVLPELDSVNTAVFAFGAADFLIAPDLLEELSNAYLHAKWIGCSTAGEILGTELNDNSLTVAVCKFEHSTIATASVMIENAAASDSCGRSLAAQLNRPDLRGVMVFADGLNVNGSELIRGMNAVLPRSVVITGGMAADGTRFERAWVMGTDRRPQSNLISAIGFYGDRIRIGHGAESGWEAFGPERVITRSKGNILYELDHKPALDLYRNYLGERASGLPATGLLFPLALWAKRTDQRKLIRTIIGVDEAAKALVFAGDMPEGFHAQLMLGNFDRLIAGAEGAARSVQGLDAFQEPVLALPVSSFGRRMALGERAEDELEAALRLLPASARQVGFYSYGEFAPLSTGASTELHNQSLALTTLCEIPS